jgi:RNA polymerase sigma factor (sigma-70 family)
MSVTASGGHEGRFERGTDAQGRGVKLPARLLRLASDERLVEHVRAGSEAAFEVLYRRHHRGVLSFCRHMLGSAEEAEDAVQHAFLAAYRDLQGSAKGINLRPWLYAIARNRCLTVLRARRERPSAEAAEPATEHLSHEVERRDDLRAMLGDLAELPADQRAAVLLTELGDLSHDEIAAVLGCRREKVKALVFQARSSLIASRTARETSCAEIREQLSVLTGAALRRNTLRKHLRGCAGCREFRDAVASQRRALALILPVAPSLGLKAAVVGGAGAAVGGVAGSGAGGVVAAAVAVLAVAGGGTAAVRGVGDDERVRAERPPAVERVVPATPTVAAPSEPRSPAVTPKPRGHAPAVSKAPPSRRKARRVAAGGGAAVVTEEPGASAETPAAENRSSSQAPPNPSTGAPPPGQAKAKPVHPAKPEKPVRAPKAEKVKAIAVPERVPVEVPAADAGQGNGNGNAYGRDKAKKNADG